MIELKNYINGAFHPPVGGAYLDNVEPAKGKVYSRIPRSGAGDVEQAVQAAKAAFPIWSGYTHQKRSAILQKLSELIDANLDRLAAAESRDNGKPLKLAKVVDIPRARDNFSFFATAILHWESQMHQMADGINYTLRQPIGIVGCISPWNLPLYLFSWKIAPALAAGNCVVAKPSEVTPYTAYLLGELCTEAGMPAGVLNILHGLGGEVGQAIVDHPEIKAISFTGGTETGARIARSAAPVFKKLSLELGGKNPNIVFADCDFDLAVSTSVKASFSNQGQICLCGSRIFIEEGIYERFRDAFVAKVKALKIGAPDAEDTQFGAVVSEAHMEKVLGYIQLAKEEGGQLLSGGERVHLEGDYAGGYFIAPTVFEGLPFDCRTNQEEIFGPVVSLIPFRSEDEVLAMANSTKYGLSSTIFTSDLNKAHRIASLIQAGIVWINCWLLRDLRTPFGGMKASGVGREGGWNALEFFTEAKNVCLQYPAKV